LWGIKWVSPPFYCLFIYSSSVCFVHPPNAPSQMPPVHAAEDEPEVELEEEEEEAEGEEGEGKKGKEEEKEEDEHKEEDDGDEVEEEGKEEEDEKPAVTAPLIYLQFTRLSVTYRDTSADVMPTFLIHVKLAHVPAFRNLLLSRYLATIS